MDGKTLMITGASTGIGRACALHFDKKGHTVFAGVRKDEDAQNLKNEASEKLTPVMIDVTDYDSVIKAAKVVDEAVGEAGLDGLVNNAGIAVSGPLEFLPIKRFEQQFQVNVFGLMAVTQAFLPLLRKTKGRIVNIGSESGRFALPFVGPYAASKHAVEAISDSLRVELLPSGIKVVLIEPASIKTPIWDKSGKEVETLVDEIPEKGREIYKKEVKASIKFVDIARKNAIPVKRVVKAVDKALTKRSPKVRYLVGAEAYLMAHVLNALPRKLVDKVLSIGIRSI
jgi:NAD(P)-dependent dehydrogenase (short-subunit alcohol dehydrogenase family)